MHVRMIMCFLCSVLFCGVFRRRPADEFSADEFSEQSRACPQVDVLVELLLEQSPGHDSVPVHFGAQPFRVDM